MIIQTMVALLGCYAAYNNSYLRFGTTYWPYIHGPIGPRMGPTGRPETSLTAILRCVTSQKREDVIYTAAET
jgi:hypothetical protein